MITMEFKIDKRLSASVLASLISVTTLLMLLFSSAVSAELPDTIPEGTTDLGNLYGYEIQFIYSPPSGSQSADTVEWDFGDGETGTGKFLSHRYSETGDYLVTQTATNSIGSSTAYYIVHICGYPAVTYHLYGDVVQTIIQTEFQVPAQMEDPVREGYTFDGWYTDSDLTVKYTNAKITVPTDLYAKWTAADPTPQDELSTAELAGIALGIVGVLGLALFAFSRNPTVLLIGVILAAAGISLYTGVISWSS